MTGDRQRQRFVAGIVRGGILAAIVVGLAAKDARGTPAPPSARALARGGIVATPLMHLEPVSEGQALAAARQWYPQLSSVTVGAELVLFSDRETDGLQSPQPAWLFTWRQITDQPLYPKADSPGGGDGTPWTHMSAVVSAVTGKVLEGFTSP